MSSSEKRQKSLIVVHAGAGYHATDNEERYLKASREACAAAMRCLKSGQSAADAVTVAVKSLEDSPCTNAGVGSNLTLDGTVECDAGLMDGKSLVFGAVGSVSGVKNPIEVAHKLVVLQLQGQMSLGRIPPSVMVGAGACRWARQHGIQCVSHSALITDASRRTYNKYKRKLDRVNNSVQNKKYKAISDCIDRDTTYSGCLPQFKTKLNSTTDQKRFSHCGSLEKSSDLQNDISACSHKHNVSQDPHIHPSKFKEPETNFLDSDLQNTSVESTCILNSDGQDSIFQDTDVVDTHVEDSQVLNTDILHTDVQDTVGAVCVDQAGNVAAAASSGGIWLKQTGRLGPAAVFGAGCWAHSGTKNKTPGVAVATSGCGEQLMKTLLAKQCGDALQKGDDGCLTFKQVLEDGFLKSEFLSGVKDKHAGVLALVFDQTCPSGVSGGDRDTSSSVEVLWGHTTSSMCVGYMSETHHKPHAFISRLPADSSPGASLAVQGKTFLF